MVLASCADDRISVTPLLGKACIDKADASWLFRLGCFFSAIGRTLFYTVATLASIFKISCLSEQAKKLKVEVVTVLAYFTSLFMWGGFPETVLSPTRDWAIDVLGDEKCREMPTNS